MAYLIVLLLLFVFVALPILLLVVLAKRVQKRRQMEAMDKKPKIGAGYYVVSGLGFIPLIGIPFAVVVIVKGITNAGNGGGKLIILGCLGILFTVGLYGSLFYEGFVVRGGVFDQLRGQMAQTELSTLVQNIEYYKTTKGHYPDSLTDVQASQAPQSYSSIYDPTFMHSLEAKPALFFYQLTPDRSHYYLLGVGPDGNPFTADDILPQISSEDRARTGLLINSASLPGSQFPPLGKSR